MKKLSLIVLLASVAVASSAQDTESRHKLKNEKQEARREKINALVHQSEEGVLVFSKQSIFGLQLRTNGVGGFYELGKMKTTRKTNIYRVDLTSIKNPKEEKVSTGGAPFSNPFVFGKQNNFYQLTLGVGQQYMLGQKGNKNGVAVSVIYNGGLAIGLLRPYYIEVKDPQSGTNRIIKYSVQDSALFLGPTIQGGGGFFKGFNEMKIKPGVFAKTALRFDYGRFNEMVSGIEVGMSAEYYTGQVPIMLLQKNKQLFFQGYLALLFGRRK